MKLSTTVEVEIKVLDAASVSALTPGPHARLVASWSPLAGLHEVDREACQVLGASRLAKEMAKVWAAEFAV